LKKLSEAHTTINELENDVNRLTVCLQHADNIENVLQLFEKYISHSLFIVVKNNVLNKDKTPKGRRFSNEIKQFALTIYFLGPSLVFTFYFFTVYFSFTSKNFLSSYY